MFAWTSLVYILCLAASILCASLLVRNFVITRNRLLLWSAVCFLFLALNNLTVVFDIFFLPETDLTEWRILFSLIGVAALIYGFVYEVDE